MPHHLNLLKTAHGRSGGKLEIDLCRRNVQERSGRSGYQYQYLHITQDERHGNRAETGMLASIAGAKRPKKLAALPDKRLATTPADVV